MNPGPTANCKLLSRGLSLALIVVAALWALPINARADIYVANHPKDSTGLVSKYDDKGVEIKAKFIEGLNSPGALLLNDDILFVIDGNTVGKYDAKTGAAINASFITGLDDPIGLAVSDTSLFIGNKRGGSFGQGRVAEYDAVTGKILNAEAFRSRILSSPSALAVSVGVLYVPCSHVMFQYFVDGGVVTDYLTPINHPFGSAFFGIHLFVSDDENNEIYRFYNPYQPAGDGRGWKANLNKPTYLAVSGSKLFVVMSGSGTVAEYDAVQGYVINENLITGLNLPGGIAVKIASKKIILQVPR